MSDHPLCSQPVVEACLALPTALLTAGGRDRGLARKAFRERLPDTIVNRRSKGEMTRIYGRLIVDNLDILRPWLIDGRLAALGLIDRATAETELTPEALIWRGQHSVHPGDRGAGGMDTSLGRSPGACRVNRSESERVRSSQSKTCA